MVLGVGGRGAAGFRIIRHAWDRHHFHVFGRWERGDWLQNHKKRMGQSAFSWFWECAGRGAACLRIIRNAKECHNFRGFESAREGAVGSRIIRNAWNNYHFHGFVSGREGGGGVQNQKNCMGLSSFSCLWKWVGGGREASESQEMDRTVSIFTVLEV